MENIEYLKKQISIMLNLFNGKHYDDLIYKGNLLIKKFPDQAILYNLVSLAYNALGKGIQAKELLLKILKKQPKNFNVLNNLGLACTELNDFEQAEEYYNCAIKLNSNFPDPLVNLGNLKTKQNKSEEAKNLFIKSLRINDKIIPAKISLAGYHEQSGNFLEAKKIYEEVLNINPNYTIADKSLSLIHKYSLNDEHIKTMEQKLIKNNDVESKQRLNFALGKAYEDIGDFKKSFIFYKTGNELYKKKINYSFDDENKSFDKIKKNFEKKKTSSLNNDGQKIIFILGMPRSGTTLAEQILSSHKNVYGAGELSFLKEAIEHELTEKDGHFNFDITNLKKTQKYYLEKIKIFGNKKEYLIDKAPLNFKWIGLINLIFPNSKIIHCKRNAMDICWSNYKNTFASKLMNYSYNFKDLTNFYKAYDDLMKFWKKNYDNDIFDLVYEELVADKSAKTKKLLEFCDLEWDENCLNFHKNKKSVSTASLAQVRQPLYNTSVEKWKSYSEELSELKKLLKI
tara:strand:+ start:233 stop:1768 length:1536 start_codon:yes stop_codon:yes gene_type:complete